MLKITHANNQKKIGQKKNLGLPPKTGYNLSSETTPPPLPKINPNFSQKNAMLNLLFQFFLLLFWRYQIKMLYWVPCFLCLGARTKKHRSLTPKKNRKKIGENSSIEAFFAVQVSHNPERVLKITHANNQKKIGQKKNLGLPPKTSYNLSSETTPSPPKKKPQFFFKKMLC